jgi:hypothetical protein
MYRMTFPEPAPATSTFTTGIPPRLAVEVWMSAGIGVAAII